MAGEVERPLEIAIPIFENMTALDAIGPYEVLHRLHKVKVRFISNNPGLYTAQSRTLSLEATASFDQCPNPDVLIVPGGPVATLPLDNQPLLNWIRKAHETSLYTTSVCTGALILASAGLLDGVQATTHWMSYEKLEKLGAVPIADRVVRRGKIITAAGVSSGIDMGILLATLLRDELSAKIVQLLVEYDPQPPYDVGSVQKAGKELAQLAKAYRQSS